MIAYKAMMFAREVHKHQVRKYTGNPYIEHLAEVAAIAASVCRINIDITMAVAWLHDCIEDQDVTPRVIEDQFGLRIADAVGFLSDMETGNRAERKAASRKRLAGAMP